MEFQRRCTVRVTAVARFRRWAARGEPLAIVEIQSLLGLGTRYVLVRKLPNGNEYVVSRHRKRSAAVKAARAASRQTQ